ncbi:hypothetical protein ABPG72_002596 [Tetrahymena utriculariae]
MVKQQDENSKDYQGILSNKGQKSKALKNKLDRLIIYINATSRVHIIIRISSLLEDHSYYHKNTKKSQDKNFIFEKGETKIQQKEKNFTTQSQPSFQTECTELIQKLYSTYYK